jgi:hypothetical protein
MTMTTTTPPPVSIALDDIAALTKDYAKFQAEADKWQKAADTLKKRIQQVMGAATEATVAGDVVFTYRHTGKFNADRFSADHPDLVMKYTVTETVQRLDVATLAKEHEALFTAYRGRRFERKA